MKNKTAGAAYKAARGNLLAMLVLTAVNTLLALTGSDRYYLFTDFAAYICLPGAFMTLPGRPSGWCWARRARCW